MACLGAVIRGETDHYDYVCEAATYGISRVQLDTGVPCAFGVLTVEDMDQALARTGGGKRDSGYNAALATVQMARLVASLAARPRLTSLHSRGCRRYVTSCGKGPAFGHSRSHSMVATKRRFNPNLQKVRIDDSRHSPPGLRLHAVPEGGQGGQSGLAPLLRHRFSWPIPP